MHKHKQQEEALSLSPDQKNNIHLSSVITIYAYAVWACSLERSDAILSKDLIDGRLAKYPYISPEALIKKVEDHDKNQAIQYLIDIDITEEEEILLPNLSELGLVKVSHFWGNTGFPHGSHFPCDVNTPDGKDNKIANNEQELKSSAKSYMGSVVLIEDKENPENSKLFITFRGSRGGSMTAQGIKEALKGKGNPDWVTDLNSGPHFSVADSSLLFARDFLRKFVPVEKRSMIYNHQGISQAYYSCKPGILASLKELGIESLNSFPGNIFTTGHSLGGGLATVCAYDIRGGFSSLDNRTFPDFLSRLVANSKKNEQVMYVDDPKKIHCISYSSPAVGNDLFVQHFAKLVPNNQRIVIDCDPVTVELKKTLNLCHVHGKLDLEKFAKTLGPEVELPAHLRFKIIDSRAHMIPTVMELAHMVAEKKHNILVRTVPKTDINLHIMIKEKAIDLIDAINFQPDSSYGEVILELEHLIKTSTETAKFCIDSYYQEDSKQYSKFLHSTISTNEKILKLVEIKFSQIAITIKKELTDMNTQLQSQLGTLTPRSASTSSSRSSESPPSSPSSIASSTEGLRTSIGVLTSSGGFSFGSSPKSTTNEDQILDFNY